MHSKYSGQALAEIVVQEAKGLRHTRLAAGLVFHFFEEGAPLHAGRWRAVDVAEENGVALALANLLERPLAQRDQPGEKAGDDDKQNRTFEDPSSHGVTRPI